MRIGILAHSFSSAFTIYKAVEDIHDQEIFILLTPSPHRSAPVSYLANLARLLLTSFKGFDAKPLQLLLSGRLIFLGSPFHDVRSVETLKKLKLDVGLHNAGVIYRDVTIDVFRLGILNHHIGILPAYRGRSVVEWSILQGDPVGVTVFFIDAGIDTGSRIVVSEEIDVSSYRSVAEAKQHLFDRNGEFFRRALMILNDGELSFRMNDGSGPRYYVMSKLFQDVVDRLLQTEQ